MRGGGARIPSAGAPVPKFCHPWKPVRLPDRDLCRLPRDYIVQRLSSHQLDTSARVVIGTIQRIYSMLKGETETAPDLVMAYNHEKAVADGVNVGCDSHRMKAQI